MPTYGLQGRGQGVTTSRLAPSQYGGGSPTPPQAPTYGYGAPSPGATPYFATGANSSPALNGGVQGGVNGQQLRDTYNAAFGLGGPAFSDPGNNFTNQGYTEQAFNHLQDRFMNDPAQGYLSTMANQMLNPSAGEQYMNQNLGSLDGPGMGEQYWNQVQGQYMSPFAGEQFARQQAQAMGAQGAAGAFNSQLQGQYNDFANYQGAGNAQGQYGQSSAALANGSQGEQGLGSLAGQYGAIGQYQGGNNALGQYQQNAGYGPMAAQSFYDSVAGQFGSMGQYNDTNRADQQWQQTQQAFGDLPIANFDPFYDRARQLGTQDYNRQAAGRGVYGSSEALSGVSNFIADIEAQRANRSFDAEMQRAQEQRARQQLLGEQARMGDLSSLGAFGANMQGLQTFGNLANQAGNQTLAQQDMLGNQARMADQTGLDAFNANLRGVDTFANVNNMLGNQELARHELLGGMANNADSQATAAQNARISGVNALGSAAQAADSAEVSRFNARTGAMNEADRNQLNRMNAGADIAFRGDDSRRADYESSMNQARLTDQLGLDRQRQGADIMNQASINDLARLNATMGAAGQAEGDRQGRLNTTLDQTARYSQDLANTLGGAFGNFDSGGQADFENFMQSDIAQSIQAMDIDQKQKDQMLQVFSALMRRDK
jgi:hypothetical protein